VITGDAGSGWDWTAVVALSVAARSDALQARAAAARVNLIFIDSGFARGGRLQRGLGRARRPEELFDLL